MQKLLRGIVVGLIASFVWSATASAETVDVVPGVRVTKKAFNVPINEQPFYGFAKKNSVMLEADKTFIAAELKAAGTPEKAFERSLRNGWDALYNGYPDIAARRFNQASLFTHEPSVLYHAYAMIAYVHLKDTEYSEELFKIALTRPNPLRSLNADYGRMLLQAAKRPRDAQAVLERAAIDTPDFGTTWLNLGSARLLNGDAAAACVAAVEAAKQKNSPGVTSDLAILRQQAGCQ